jgi:hypothetical protein
MTTLAAVGTTKKLSFVIAAIAAAVFLNGCILLSVYPYYSSKDIVFEQSLIGQWTKQEDSDEHWKFEKDRERSYKLSIIEKDKPPTIMEAHLFKLRDQLFLDLAEAPDSKAGDDIFPPRIPSHMVVKVSQAKATMQLAPLKYQWVVELLDKDAKALRHHVIKQGETLDERELVVTASTEELQQFLIKHLDTEAAWKDTVDLKRDPASAKSE